LKSRISIKNFFAGIALVVFALAITPRQFLHDLVTGHTHTYSKVSGEETFKAPTKGYTCEWHQPDALSPFVESGLPSLAALPSNFVEKLFAYQAGHHHSHPRYFSLRGPPYA